MEQDFKSDRLVGRATRSTYESGLSVFYLEDMAPYAGRLYFFKRLLGARS
jgi:hypothetical protein